MGHHALLRRVLSVPALFAIVFLCGVPSAGASVPPRWVGTDTPPPGCSNPTLPGCLCPEPVTQPWNWSTRRLFSTALNPAPLLPAALMRYCVYDWLGGGLPAAGPDPAGVGQLVAETPVVVPQGCPSGAAGPDLREALHDRFLVAARGANFVPGNLQAKPLVQMALLDTAPSGDIHVPPELAGNSNTHHGLQMGWLFHDLTCANGKCLAAITSWLSLAFLNDVAADYNQGGLVGLRSDLATQLHAATWSWLDALAGEDAPKRLVIPLAVGWAEPVPKPGGATPSAAVKDAIQYAACHGAIVLASAGNDTSIGAGTLFPAAWESESLPVHADCSDHFDPLPLPGGYLHSHAVFAAQASGPLVISVGGLDDSNRPITRTRPNSLKRFAALGAFGTTAANGPQPSGFYPALTGTSLSVMVAGATIAAAWSAVPTVAAADLEQLLYPSASVNPVPANLFDPQVCVNNCQVLGLTMCPAVRHACMGGACLIVPPNCPQVSLPPTTCAKNQLTLGGINPVVSWPSGGVTPWGILGSGAIPPFIHPQPGDPHCDTCGFLPNVNHGDLFVKVVMSQTTQVMAMDLVLRDAAYTQQAFISIPFNQNALMAGAWFNLTPMAIQPVSATIIWTVLNPGGANIVEEEQIPILN